MRLCARTLYLVIFISLLNISLYCSAEDNDEVKLESRPATPFNKSNFDLLMDSAEKAAVDRKEFYAAFIHPAIIDVTNTSGGLILTDFPDTLEKLVNGAFWQIEQTQRTTINVNSVTLVCWQRHAAKLAQPLANATAQGNTHTQQADILARFVRKAIAGTLNQESDDE